MQLRVVVVNALDHPRKEVLVVDEIGDRDLQISGSAHSTAPQISGFSTLLPGLFRRFLLFARMEPFLPI